MLDSEHFLNAMMAIRDYKGRGITPDFIAAKIERAKGTMVPSLARNRLGEAIYIDGVKTVHIKNSNRFYCITEAEGSVVRVEGFVGWDPKPRKESEYLFPELMIPIEIAQAGVISSNGGRISPLDQRLKVLAYDLFDASRITGGNYEQEKMRVNDHVGWDDLDTP